MIGYSRGDVVLINFLFADGTGTKRRPAVIMSSDAYHAGRAEVIIAAITSRTDRLLPGAHLIKDWDGAGLLFPSVATGIIRTIKLDMITRKLGAMSTSDMNAINRELKVALGLT